MFLQIVFIKKKLLVIGCQWVNKQSLDFAYDSERFFLTGSPAQGSINMVKVLSFRFQQCFGPFTMSLLKGSP